MPACLLLRTINGNLVRTPHAFQEVLMPGFAATALRILALSHYVEGHQGK